MTVSVNIFLVFWSCFLFLPLELSAATVFSGRSFSDGIAFQQYKIKKEEKKEKKNAEKKNKKNITQK